MQTKKPFLFFSYSLIPKMARQKTDDSRSPQTSIAEHEIRTIQDRLGPQCANRRLGHRNHNRNLETSKALLKSQAHQATSLFTSAATNQRGVSKGGQEKLRSEFQSTRRGQSSC